MTRAETFILVSIMTNEEQERYIANIKCMGVNRMPFIRNKPFILMRRKLIMLSFSWLTSDEKYAYWHNIHIRYLTYINTYNL